MTPQQIEHIDEMHNAMNKLFEEYCAAMTEQDPEWCIEDDDKALFAVRVLNFYHTWRSQA